MKENLIKNSGMALTSGILVALMVTANGMLAARMGNWISLVIIHLVGLLTASFVLILKKSFSNIIKGVPLRFMLGGALGVFTVLMNNVCVNNIGVAMTLGLALVGQIIASAVVEHMGIMGMKKNKFSPRKIPAYILMIAGAVIMIVWG